MAIHNNLASTLSEYADKLFLGILSRNIDASISEFVTKYVPVVLKKYNREGEWIAYAPDQIKEPKFETIINALIFYKHPYFDGSFTSGKLAITQKIYNDEKWIDNITDIKLWFVFDNKKDAKNSYEKLVDTFSSFNVLKRLTLNNGINKAEFTDTNCNKYYNHVQVILAKDNFTGKKLAIPSEEGFKFRIKPAYKILLEMDNDLY